MTLQEAAIHLNRSPHTLRRHIKEGKLKANLINNRRYDVSNESIQRYIDEYGMGNQTPVDNVQIDKLINQISKLNEQLIKLQDELIAERQRSDSIIVQLTNQLSQQTRLLEYHQIPWWKRWFRADKRVEYSPTSSTSAMSQR